MLPLFYLYWVILVWGWLAWGQPLIFIGCGSKMLITETV